MNKLPRFLASLVLVLALSLTVAFATYRTVMTNVQIEFSGQTVTLTVFGQQDVYTLGG